MNVPTQRPSESEPRTVAESLTELFGTDLRGEPVEHQDGKTGARLERITVDGQRYVVKHLHRAEDWLMRACGDLHPRPVTVWQEGWLDRLPESIDSAVVTAAWEERDDGRGAVLVMRDVGPHLVPEDQPRLPLDHHHGFVDHMAQMHATFWGEEATPGLLPFATRLVMFGPRLGETERALGGTDVVPTQLIPEGWARLAERTPEAARIVSTLLLDPTPLVSGAASTPQTLLHGDWKLGNLGSHPDGRTILLDWAVPGIGPGCFDLAWYVCLNREPLPETKEATIQRYRDALERHGIDTGGWWDRQLALSLLGIMLVFGWEKALGDADELGWWEERIFAGARWLDR
jgi:hypothetical protein